MKPPALLRRRRNLPKAVFNEKTYGRNVISRLTPLAWFLIAVAVFVFMGAALLVINRIDDASYKSVVLSERLGITITAEPDMQVALAAPFNGTADAAETPVVIVVTVIDATGVVTTFVTATPDAARIARKTSTPRPSPTPTTINMPTETPEPTAVKRVISGGGPIRVSYPTAIYANAQPVSGPTPIGGAPWASLLVRQPDGTLLAPSEVISQAVSDLGEYYKKMRDLPMVDYLADRDKILLKYFTGEALKEKQDMEKQRTQYELNIGGSVDIIVRNFTPDGYTAKAGIYLRDWQTDDYDVSSKVLLRTGVKHPDFLIVMTVVYDKVNARWVYQSSALSSELKP